MPSVPLKSNVAKSRSRLSLCNQLDDDADWEAPTEVCFKLKTDRVVKGLEISEGARVSLSQSASGSYDEATFLRYLRKWIPEWTPERAADRDYRFMYLDDYRVHNMESVRLCLWERGFFRIRRAPLPIL